MRNERTLILLFAILLKGSIAFGALGDIVSQFGVPGFDPRGLAWDGTNLWHADGMNQAIYKLDASTGAVLDSFSSPGTNPFDLAFISGNLWNVDISSRAFYSVNPASGPPWTLEFTTAANDYTGLTYDGTSIWTSDPLAGGDVIEKLDLSGNVLVSFPSPGPDPTGLAWDGTNLWLGDGNTDLIYKIDPSSGAVLDSFSAPGGYITGLTFDGINLWASDKNTGQIYQLDLGATPAPPGVVTLLSMLGGLGGWAGLRRARRRKSVV